VTEADIVASRQNVKHWKSHTSLLPSTAVKKNVVISEQNLQDYSEDEENTQRRVH
jgi:hypothetical protein